MHCEGSVFVLEDGVGVGLTDAKSLRVGSRVGALVSGDGVAVVGSASSLKIGSGIVVFVSGDRVAVVGSES